MRQVVLISGRTCTGKSGLAKGSEKQFDYYLIPTSEILKMRAVADGRKVDRVSLQQLGGIVNSSQP